MTTSRSNKDFCHRDHPENQRKNEKRKGSERAQEKKRLAAVFCFYIVDFRKRFLRTKKQLDSNLGIQANLKALIITSTFTIRIPLVHKS